MCFIPEANNRIAHTVLVANPAHTRRLKQPVATCAWLEAQPSRGEYAQCSAMNRPHGGEISTVSATGALTKMATGFRNPMYLNCHYKDELCAAMELGEDGIRVNCVVPTAMTERMRTVMQWRARAVGKDSAEAANPNGRRLGEPSEIAAAMLFLAFEDSSFVAGSELLVDGGMCSV